MFSKKSKLELKITKDPYKETTSDGLERYMAYLVASIHELEQGKQFDPTYLVCSAMFSYKYITICRKEDKTKSIPKKLEKVIQSCIMSRTTTLLNVYKDLVELYNSVQ